MTTAPTSPASTRSAIDLRELIEQELTELVAIRHDLHAHPELGYEEKRTSGVVRRELEKAGIDFAPDLAGGTGVLGHIPGGKNGAKAIGLRADMDALRILEQTGAEHASKTPGIMHACGHDGHTTILIGAARVLAKVAKQQTLPRPVTFVFQPAEEGGAGGQKMVQEGCLDGSIIGPPIEHMFGLHGWPQLALGSVTTRNGPMLAAADMFEITVRGTGAHAAFPHTGRDSLLAGALIVTALQQIASRNANPLDAVVVSVTQFHGGTAHNVIPSEVKLGGTVRTLLPETQQLAQDRLREIAMNIAEAHGCEASVEYQLGYPVTRNDPEAVAIFIATAKEALGEERVPPMEHPVMGGEDFSYYCHEVPSCFFALGLIPPGKSSMPELHQPNFDFNDEAIPIGIELFCRLVLRA